MFCINNLRAFAEQNIKILSPGVLWASINLGVFLCIKCAGVHRSMGVRTSFVRSITMDDWSDEQVQCMKDLGNSTANAYWEDSVCDMKITERASRYVVNFKFLRILCLFWPT